MENEHYLERMLNKAQLQIESLRVERLSLKAQLEAYKNLVAQMEVNLKTALEMNGLTNKIQEK